MPVYDYKCDKCNHLFEIEQRITEEPLKHCPKCKGHIRRLINPVGIVFKGSGFHINDYSKDRKRATSPAKSSTTPKKK